MRVLGVRRVLIALAIGAAISVAPAATYAGGGIGGGGVGGLVVTIDHPSVPGHNWAFLDYFSRTVTVHQGDVVTWQFANTPLEPHTVTFLPAGVPATPQGERRLIPGGGGPIPDTDDHIPNNIAFPFNFDQAQACGGSPYFPATGPCAYDGRTIVNSGFMIRTLGAPLGATPAPTFSVRFNAAPGVYHYFCLIHGPRMSGTVRVVAANAPADTQAAIDARAGRQFQAAWTHARTFESRLHPPARTVGGHTVYTVLTGAEYGRVAINEFIPARVNLKPGDTVNWTPGFHTVTFPSELKLPPFALDCEAPGQDRPFRGAFAGCNGLELGIFPRSDLPSGPPGQSYGGGFYNSGILVIPQPHTWSATFPKGGTFHYDCLIHPGMDGVIQSG